MHLVLAAAASSANTDIGIPSWVVTLFNMGVTGILAFLLIGRKLITPGELKERVDAERENANTWKIVAEVNQARAERAEHALEGMMEQGKLAVTMLGALKSVQGGQATVQQLPGQE